DLPVICRTYLAEKPVCSLWSILVLSIILSYIMYHVNSFRVFAMIPPASWVRTWPDVHLRWISSSNANRPNGACTTGIHYVESHPSSRPIVAVGSPVHSTPSYWQ